MNALPDIKSQFAEWYQEVIVQADLIDQSPTKGCFVFKPYSYALWENIQKVLDGKIKELGAENAYFPLLIPESFLKREAKHVEGFSPELAVVTHGGGKQLEEPLVVRPTSETMIYHMFSRWISSWRDLPLKINQWANVVRWEMRTRPFVRSLEFLWQEGHTAHASHEEALEMVLAALAAYKDLYENYLAVPGICGMKSDSERFAGADRTYTIESLMQDGKALQMCTSHLLAHSFPESFDMKFQDADGNSQVPWCTSWGFTTRSIGAVVMTHGDQLGLVMPPRVAPIQVVIIPIFKNDEEKAAVLGIANQVRAELTQVGLRVKLDTRDQMTPGSKFFDWDIKGVPARIEIGPKDVAAGHVVVASRIEQDRQKKKQFVPVVGIVQAVQDLLEAIQKEMFVRAQARINAQWYQVDKLVDFGKSLDEKHGFYQTGWCGSAACEEKLKEYKGSIRCLLEKHEHTHCFACDQKSKTDVLTAKSY